MNLTLNERAELNRHEEVIRRGLQNFVEVGIALMAIREKKLHKEDYPTFEEYVAVKWGMSKTHANRLIAAAGVALNLAPTGVTPENEAQARELVGYSQETQILAMEQARENTGGRPPTSAEIKRAIQETVCKHKGKLPPADVERAIEETEDDLIEGGKEAAHQEVIAKHARYLIASLAKARKHATALGDHDLIEDIADCLRRAKETWG